MIPKPLLAAALGGCVAVPAVAFAGNGLEPRTPVDWPDDAACLTVVDRSESAMVHMDYGIPFEDPEITPDEVADSRRHQFIAFCRDHSREEFLPIWLSWKDVDAAAAKALIDPMLLEDENVLETSTVWKDCWFRITPDDARRPITFAEAMKGVDWDTTALAAGAYVVQGYTWEPTFNIYSQRPGIVHVVDGPDLAAVGPAAAVSTVIDFMFAEDTLMLEGCTRALPGSTLSGYWSHTGGALEWMPFAEGGSDRRRDLRAAVLAVRRRREKDRRPADRCHRPDAAHLQRLPEQLAHDLARQQRRHDDRLRSGRVVHRQPLRHRGDQRPSGDDSGVVDG